MNEGILTDILIRVRGAGVERAHRLIVLNADKGVDLGNTLPEAPIPVSGPTLDIIASIFSTKNERQQWLVLVLNRPEEYPQGPILVSPRVRIIDAAKFAQATIRDLLNYVEAKNRGTRHWVDRVLGEKLRQLELCGVKAEIRRIR